MIVAVIIDSHFVEPIVVVCDDMLSANRAVASYLEAAAPVLVSTGERVEPRPTSTEVAEWVSQVLEDVDDVNVDFLPADGVGQHQTWCLANREALRRSHQPRIETIKVREDLL